VSRADDGIALPMAHLLAIFNVAWPLTDRARIGNLSAPVTPAQMAFASGFLASKVLVQIASSGLVRVNMQIDTFMAYRHLACNLLRAQLDAQIEIDLSPDLGLHTNGLASVLGSFRRFGARLFGAIPTLATPADKFAADGATAPAQQSGDLADGLFGFQEAVNLVSFFSAEVVVHWATSTWRLKRP